MRPALLKSRLLAGLAGIAGGWSDFSSGLSFSRRISFHDVSEQQKKKEKKAKVEAARPLRC